MCNPAIAVTVAAGVLQQQQQSSAASATNKFGKSQFTANKGEALRAMVESFKGGQTRIEQERVSTAQALQELTRQAAEARGTVKASSTSVSGNSLDALLDDYTRQETIREEVLSTNLANAETSLVQDFDVIRSNTETRIRSGIAQPVQVPSFLNAAVQIGASALAVYGQTEGFGKQ